MEIFKLIRVNNYIKNILIFTPIFVGSNLDENDYLNLLIGFISFSFCASFVYIFNDIKDLESDRNHPKKKFRSLASSKISIKTAIFIGVILLTLSFIIPLYFKIYIIPQLLILYIFVNILYTYFLKKEIFLDLILLNSFYMIRISMGILIVGDQLSNWIIGFSIFFFTGIAMLKRSNELMLLSKNNLDNKSRGYSIEHKKPLESSLKIFLIGALLFLNIYFQFNIPLHPISIIIVNYLYLYCYLLVTSSNNNDNDDPVIIFLSNKKLLLSSIFSIIIILCDIKDLF